MQNATANAPIQPASGPSHLPPKILITEDEYIVAFDLKLRLRKLGYDIVGIAASGDDAIIQTEDSKPDLVLMDIQLHGSMDGIEAARQIRENHDIPIIYLTANSDQATIERATKTHAFSYLMKPFNERELQFAIEKAVSHHRMEKLLREANERLEERVKTRTAELAESYSSLQNELRLHQKTLGELRAAQAVASQADRAKNEFLATISHELLTPMNGILGTLDVMLGAGSSHHDNEQLNIVKASAENLLDLIHDLLDFSRMQNGTLELHPVSFSPGEQLLAFLKPLALRAAEKGLSLGWHFAENLPAQVVADPDRIGQVLVSLVDNAIKFTDHGKVTVSLAPLRQQGDKVQVRFAVQDTGIGIPADRRNHIFEPFIQADGSHSRRHGGVGLGLSIASKIVTSMGGQIHLESEPGKGSTFSFDLLLDTPDAPHLTAALL